MKNLLYLLVFVLVSSCSKNAKNLKDTFGLVPKEVYVLPIDTLTPSQSFFGINQLDKTGDFLYLIDTKKNIVRKYDYKTKKQLATIKLEVEGPNGVGHVSDILPCGADSIFVLSGYTYELSLINSKGKLLKKYRLLSNDIKLNGHGIPEGGYASLPIGNNENHISKKGDFIYLGAYPILNNDDKDYYEKGKSGISINIETGEHYYLIDYPKTYLNAYQQGWRFPGQYVWSSQTFNEEKGLCIFSFPADKNVYVYNVQTKKTSVHETPSAYFEDIVLSKNIHPNADENYDFCVKNHNYERIYYDKYRKLYLRYCQHPNPKKNSPKDEHADMIMSIIIMNDKFERLGETMLDEKLGAGILFFRPEGIYLQSISYDEDQIQFTRYELVKK
jgi:hypothetical protein